VIQKRIFFRCIRNSPINHIHKCEGLNCNILIKKESNNIQKPFDLEWAHKNFPVVKSLNDPILPFYYSKSPSNGLNIKIVNFDQNFDGCFEIKAFVTRSSKLQIKNGNTNSIEISASWNGYGLIDWSPENIYERVCIRDLFADVQKSSTISLIGNSNLNEEEIVAIKFNSRINPDNDTIEFQESNAAFRISYILQNSFGESRDQSFGKKYTFNNQWPIQYPQHLWLRDELDWSHTIDFVGRGISFSNHFKY